MFGRSNKNASLEIKKTAALVGSSRSTQSKNVEDTGSKKAPLGCANTTIHSPQMLILQLPNRKETTKKNFMTGTYSENPGG